MEEEKINFVAILAEREQMRKQQKLVARDRQRQAMRDDMAARKREAARRRARENGAPTGPGQPLQPRNNPSMNGSWPARPEQKIAAGFMMPTMQPKTNPGAAARGHVGRGGGAGGDGAFGMIPGGAGGGGRMGQSRGSNNVPRGAGNASSHAATARVQIVKTNASSQANVLATHDAMTEDRPFQPRPSSNFYRRYE